MRYTVAFLFVFAMVGVGFFVNLNSKQFPLEKQNFSSVAPTSRDPAAIKKIYDFSSLKGQPLESALKHRLLNEVRVYQEVASVGLEFGHFVLQGPDGAKTFACQKYSKVLIKFEADGVAVGGEKPQMEVESDCLISADINFMNPIWIPVAKIRGEPVADGEFDFREQQKTKVRFSHVSDSWPKNWVLKSVTLLDTETSQNLEVSTEDLKKQNAKPITVDF